MRLRLEAYGFAGNVSGKVNFYDDHPFEGYLKTMLNAIPVEKICLGLSIGELLPSAIQRN